MLHALPLEEDFELFISSSRFLRSPENVASLIGALDFLIQEAFKSASSGISSRLQVIQVGFKWVSSRLQVGFQDGVPWHLDSALGHDNDSRRSKLRRPFLRNEPILWDGVAVVRHIVLIIVQNQNASVSEAGTPKRFLISEIVTAAERLFVVKRFRARTEFAQSGATMSAHTDLGDLMGNLADWRDARSSAKVRLWHQHWVRENLDRECS